MCEAMKPWWAILRYGVLVCASLFLPLNEALADLMLHPTRIVFDKSVRATQVDLINRGAETSTYRISVVNRRMNEMGQFQDVDTPEPGEQFAESMLRYSPRQVTLAPGAAQTIRILLRKPENLAAGEYRSHLLFQAVAEGQKPAPVPGGPQGEGLDISLRALVSVSIPVIVRHGETRASAEVGDLAVEKGAAGEPTLVLELRRTGNRSLYGDLQVNYVPPTGKETVVGRANGVAVYTPNAIRRARIALKPLDGIDLTRGALHVVFRDRPEEGGKVIAERRLRLP